MKNPKLYNELARYYDLLYSFKDYKKEAQRIKTLISEYKTSKGNELLDVGCGTGHHVLYLKDDFSCTGIDISEEALKIARRNVGNAFFLKGDMRNFDLKKEFDVIICLFSSIGYVKTYQNLRKTLHNFARHLKKGGVALIEPWLTKSEYRIGSPHMTVYDGEDIKIARLSFPRLKGDLSVVDMHYLVVERGKGIRHAAEQHELGLFDVEKTLEYMKEAGLRSKFLREESLSQRGIFISVK